jgi:tellurite resistance protein
MSGKGKGKSGDDLEKHAEAIRKDLAVPKQNEIFKVAVEAGYLAALADGEVDDDELAAIARAVNVLSKGAIIEWEVETLLEECKARVEKEGVAKRSEALGAILKDLGQPEAGLLFAAFVAHATGGVDADETAALEAIGKAAGLPKGRVATIAKKAQAS